MLTLRGVPAEADPTYVRKDTWRLVGKAVTCGMGRKLRCLCEVARRLAIFRTGGDAVISPALFHRTVNVCWYHWCPSDICFSQISWRIGELQACRRPHTVGAAVRRHRT